MAIESNRFLHLPTSFAGMATPYLGEIKICAFNFAPKGWAQANGQTLPINQNQALFSLFGTTYGGNGQTTFGLPNLQGRVALHVGNGFTQGQIGGEYAHTLHINEIPQHAHALIASSDPGTSNIPTGNRLAAVSNVYGPAQNLVAMNQASLSAAGGSQGHENRQPFTVLMFIVAITNGIFPSQN